MCPNSTKRPGSCTRGMHKGTLPCCWVPKNGLKYPYKSQHVTRYQTYPPYFHYSLLSPFCRVIHIRASSNGEDVCSSPSEVVLYDRAVAAHDRTSSNTSQPQSAMPYHVLQSPDGINAAVTQVVIKDGFLSAKLSATLFAIHKLQFPAIYLWKCFRSGGIR